MDSRICQTSTASPAEPGGLLAALDDWMRAYTEKVHAVYADYYSAMVDAQGMLKDGFSEDGLHPNVKGYALVAPVAEAAIEKALGKN